MRLDLAAVFLRAGFLWTFRAAGLRFTVRAFRTLGRFLPRFRADRDLADDLDRARFCAADLGRLRVVLREAFRLTLRFGLLRPTLRFALLRPDLRFGLLRPTFLFADEALRPFDFLRLGRAAGRFFFRLTVRLGVRRVVRFFVRFTDRFFAARLRAVFFRAAGFFFAFLWELFFCAIPSSYFRHSLDMIYRITSELFWQNDDAGVPGVIGIPAVLEQQGGE
jgi:hypothetical protein